MKNNTYVDVSVPQTNVDKLLELWNSFGATKLFLLEVDYSQGSVSHKYVLKDTTLMVVATTTSVDDYQLKFYNASLEIDAARFWELVPAENKKVLAYHLDQII